MELILLEETDSTNSHLRRMVESGTARHGSMVCALSQTKGRGQRGNSWWSPPGLGLYVSSYYVLGSVAADKQGLWAKSWALSAQRYVASKLGYSKPQRAVIKWPNDILVDYCKIGGMLVENSVRGTFISDCIVGIGINLNQDRFSNFETQATSLCMITGETYDPAREALELASHLDWSLAAIQSNAQNVISMAYEDCLFGLNAQLDFDHAGEKVTALFRGVDENGHAILESASGRMSVSHPDYRLSGVPFSNS